MLSRFRFPILFTIVMWLSFLFQYISRISLLGFGIMPRALDGLDGIIFAPLLHSSVAHIMSNSAPLIVSMVMIWFFYRKVAMMSFTLIYLLTGLSVWAFAFNSHSIHVGASGVVYGLVSFIFWSGVFRRNLKSIVLSLIIIFLYSGMLYGVLPTRTGVSWESHLYGAIVGAFVAYWYRNRIEKDEIPQVPSWELEPEKEEHFLDRDIFFKSENMD